MSARQHDRLNEGLQRSLVQCHQRFEEAPIGKNERLDPKFKGVNLARATSTSILRGSTICLKRSADELIDGEAVAPIARAISLSPRSVV